MQQWNAIDREYLEADEVGDGMYGSRILLVKQLCSCVTCEDEALCEGKPRNGPVADSCESHHQKGL